MTNQKKQNLLFDLWLPIAVLSLYVVALSKKFFYWDFDDGFIVYRIAKNILEHSEWSYNLAEAHNASTSVLNTLLVTAFGFLTSDIRQAAHYLGGLSLLISGVFTFLLFRSRAGTSLSLIGSAWLIHFVAHSSTWGIETHLFLALFLFFIYQERLSCFTWPTISFLILTRPDAILLAGLKFLKSLFRDRSSLSKGVVICGLILLPWIVFSLINFGQLFPDTLSSKVWQGNSGYWGNGLVYLKALTKHLFVEDWQKAVIFALALPGFYSWIRSKDTFLYFLSFSVLQQAAYIILNVPGYHWYFFSFDIALILGVIEGGSLLFKQLEPICRNYSILIKNSAFLLTLGYLTFLSGTLISLDTFSKDVRNESYKKAIKYLDTVETGQGELATLEVGTFGYYSSRQIVDLVGLTSKNPEYISGKHLDNYFKNPAELVLLHKPLWHFERALYDDLRFRIIYEFKNNIEDPYFALQYFKLKADKKVLTPDLIRKYITLNYTDFQKLGEDKNTLLIPTKEALCILDQINGQLVVTNEVTIPRHVLRVSGWAVNEDSEVLFDPEIYLINVEANVATKEIYTHKATRFARPDVATHLGNDNYNMAGYEVEASILDLAPGIYEIGVVQSLKEIAIFCKFAVKVTIN